jgi:Transposase DDE domain
MSPQENTYYCPEGKPLRYRGLSRMQSGLNLSCDGSTMSGMSAEKLCTPGLYRKLFVRWQEPAPRATRALAGTPAYKHSQRARYKVEALFAELKQQIKLRRVRLRRLWNVAEQFHLAATAQNLKRLVRHLDHKRSQGLSTI